MTEASLKTYTHAPPSGSKPESMVILLHGWGANGQDLIGLAPLLAQALPNTVFVSPDAPEVCDMNPMGYQWFSLGDWSSETRLSGTRKAAPVVDGYITEMREAYEIPADKTALLGFSQGTMMSLYTAPRYPEPLAGVLGYSGALLWGDDTNPDELNKVPVHLIHGEADDVVPVTAYHAAKETLEDSGFTVTGHTTPGLMHNIDPEGIKSGAEFLSKILS